MLRLYWLGPATEFGRWAIDTGPGTKVLRVDFPVVEDAIFHGHHNDTAITRPRGWSEFTPNARWTFDTTNTINWRLTNEEVLKLIEIDGVTL
jgi:hypothetical protein